MLAVCFHHADEVLLLHVFDALLEIFGTHPSITNACAKGDDTAQHRPISHGIAECSTELGKY